MAFTQFNNDGYKMLSAEMVHELNDLAQRHGLDIDCAGGSLGQNEMTIKVRCRTTDTDAIQRAEKARFGQTCHHVGLEASDYGLEFAYNGDRFRITGVKPSRPKYPISAVSLRDKRSFKLPHGAAAAVKAARSVRDAEAAKANALTGNRTKEAAQFAGEWA